MAKKKHPHPTPAPPPIEADVPPDPSPPEVPDGPDYSNWEEEKGKLVDEILEIVKQQRDALADTQTGGTLQINPQSFTQGDHLIVGPISFGTPFQGEPIVVFGQKPETIGSQVMVSTTATAYKPFLVDCYVDSWSREGTGAIVGFNIGVYAKVKPETGSLAALQPHTITWEAFGKASPYKDERTSEAWAEPGDPSSPDFLEETM